MLEDCVPWCVLSMVGFHTMSLPLVQVSSACNPMFRGLAGEDIEALTRCDEPAKVCLSQADMVNTIM
eukprot:1959307-Amphidinium_carterae.1